MSTRPKAHLYFPENDLALAADLDNYTPPRQAQIMHRDGATLPLWYGRDGDVFIAQGVNDRWYGFVRDAFGMYVDIFTDNVCEYDPAPWGWSRASRRAYMRAGFSPASLPDNRQLQLIRELSNRLTAIDIAHRLSSTLDIDMTTPAVPAYNIDTVTEAVREFSKAIIQDTLVKCRTWYNSGRHPRT